MELHLWHVTVHATCDFWSLSKVDFRVGKQFLNFLVKMIWIRPNFFQSTCKSLGNVFICIENKKNRFKIIFVEIFNCFEIFTFGRLWCNLFLRDFFIQRLINNIGRELSWILIFSPDRLILKNYIKRLPGTGRLENPMYRSMNFICLIL